MATTTRVYHCARCGKQLRGEEWLYSRFTRLRYCTDVDRCAKRAQRKG